PFLAEVNKAQGEITQQWRIQADQDTLALPPTPPAGSTPVMLRRTEDAQELPTMKMNDDELILAERQLAARQKPPPPPSMTPEKPVGVVAPPRSAATQVLRKPAPPSGFEFPDEPTRAPRAQRKGAMTRPSKEQHMAAPPKRRP